MAFARLILIAFLLLTAVYFALFYHLRGQRRDRLEREWSETAQGEMQGYVDGGLKEFEPRLRRGLVLGVYILPLVVMLTTIYVTNFL